MRRTITVIAASLFMLALAGCLGTAPIIYSYTDLHTNTLIETKTSSLRGMKAGIIHIRLHYTNYQGNDKENSRKEELQLIQELKKVFAYEAVYSLRGNTPFTLIESGLKPAPRLTPERVGRQSKQKFLLLQLSEADSNKAAGFIAENNLDAALTIDAYIENTYLQKQSYLVFRIDWIMLGTDGKEIYNVTTYNNAPINNATITPDTIHAVIKLTREGAQDFTDSIRAILKKG